MKGYIRVDATKELPDNPGYYIIGWTDGIETYEDSCSLSTSKKWAANEGTEVRYWLKEIDLSELRIEFIIFANQKYRYMENDKFWSKRDCASNFKEGNYDDCYIQTNELLSDFLTQKSISIKD